MHNKALFIYNLGEGNVLNISQMLNVGCIFVKIPAILVFELPTDQFGILFYFFGRFCLGKVKHQSNISQTYRGGGGGHLKFEKISL